MSLGRTRAQPTQQRFSYRRIYVSRGHRPRLQARSSGRHHFWFGPSGAHSLQQVITDSQRVGDDGKSRIHGATRTEEASIDNIKIVELMRFAVAIERACLWIISKTNRAVLVRNSGKRNALSKIQIPREQTFVALVPVKGAFVCCCISDSSFLISRLCPSSLFALYCKTMSPSRLIVTRLFGSGRSSDVSQKSSECLAMRSSVHFGAIFGAPALSVSPSSFPTNETWPIGKFQSGDPK